MSNQINSLFEHLPFLPADILLPRNCDMHLWSVVACDQYSSQPEYWQNVAQMVGNAPSTLHLILPESRLDEPNVSLTISEINQTMASYLKEGRFELCPNTMIYVERRLENGAMRRGLVGMVDLEQYDYAPDVLPLIRATEGTVSSRIPPRVAVRKNAPIELPHVMLLTDDARRTVIEPLEEQHSQMKQVYDFDLMEHGGHITGWALGESQLAQVAQALTALADPEDFHRRYGLEDQPVLLFAVGDGNHSLATAKECYERQKKFTPPEKWAELPARYALVELVNVHDESLVFEAIHRVIFRVNPKHLLSALLEAYPEAYFGQGEGHVLPYITAEGEGVITVPHPTAHLPVGTLQTFLDQYLIRNGGKIDYIHGEDVTRQLASQENAIGFLLPAMEKDQLYPTVIYDGALPRKTFSMGDAQDKRFYLEARKIR